MRLTVFKPSYHAFLNEFYDYDYLLGADHLVQTACTHADITQD